MQVRASERGYFGGQLRELGEAFTIPDELWRDESRRPKWVMADGGTSAPAVEVDQPRPRGRPRANVVAETLETPPDWLPPAVTQVDE